MIGLGTTINNLIIGFKPGVAGGIAGIVLASVSLVVTGNWHAGLFLAAFVLMTIIPGHILNYRYRHSRSDVRQAAGTAARQGDERRRSRGRRQYGGRRRSDRKRHCGGRRGNGQHCGRWRGNGQRSDGQRSDGQAAGRRRKHRTRSAA